MRRRQRHQELATAGGYAAPSQGGAARDAMSPGDLAQSTAVGGSVPMVDHNRKKPCPHCGKLCNPGALHFHLRRCENKGDVDDPAVPDVRRS